MRIISILLMFFIGLARPSYRMLLESAQQQSSKATSYTICLEKNFLGNSHGHFYAGKQVRGGVMSAFTWLVSTFTACSHILKLDRINKIIFFELYTVSIKSTVCQHCLH